jgi:2-oxoglutarate dehydrogenase E1 component
VLHDMVTGRTYAPLKNLDPRQAQFCVYNSLLSEAAVLGFDYGYSLDYPDMLCMWEAQFGDFANGAQVVIDQFIAAGESKWQRTSGLVLLLPHGYEGQGPEHSSARLERYLQMCAEGNMRVAYPSTPAQYFHILRRHAVLDPRRPLILMQPKSLLRLAQAASRLSDLTDIGFQPVIDDPAGEAKRETVRRLVFCTGKVYYDLTAQPLANDVAVVRVEELYPWPHTELTRVLDRYPNVKEVIWTQEEPKNMGAWSYVAPRLRGSVGNTLIIRYVGRPERASPAEGYPQAHAEEQQRIVGDSVTGASRLGAPRATGAMRAL